MSNNVICHGYIVILKQSQNESFEIVWILLKQNQLLTVSIDAVLLVDAGSGTFTLSLLSYSGWTPWPLAISFWVSLCCKSLVSCWIFQRASRLLWQFFSSADALSRLSLEEKCQTAKLIWCSGQTLELQGDIFHFEVPQLWNGLHHNFCYFIFWCDGAIFQSFRQQ